MGPQISSRTTARRWVVFALVAVGVAELGFAAWMFAVRERGPAVAPVTTTATETKMPGAVAAAGRFEPAESATKISAPYIDGHPGIIESIKIQEGQHVVAGQLIATLAGKAQLDAEVREVRARVTLERAKLNQGSAMPRDSETTVQKEEVARLWTALTVAQEDLKRYELLRVNHDVSQSDVDAKRAEMANTQHLLEQARARLAGLSETHVGDMQVAQSSLDEATATLQRQELDLKKLDVLSPIAGTVLHITSHAGEEVGANGIAEVAALATMDVVAEVYETDVSRVKVGQHAEVKSDSLPNAQPMQGTVTQIGDEVGRAAIVGSDPAAFADARVVPVRIRLAESRPAASLIHGKVSVVIQP